MVWTIKATYQETTMNVNLIAEQTQPPSLLTSLPSQTDSLAGSIGAPSDSVSANLSSLGEFFSELKQLSIQNPVEFKKIATEIAQKLDTQAQHPSDTTQATELKAIASRFDEASKTGDFSSLVPQSDGTTPTGSKHHGGHHHHVSYDSLAVPDAPTTDTSSVLSSIFSEVAQEIQSASGTSANTSQIR
jgi:hypothetical protein